MFSVALIEPTAKFCGGDPSVEEAPAKKYAEYPVGIFITKVNHKYLRRYKGKYKQFFTDFKVNPKDYRIHVREGWSYSTKKEATKRLKYEVKHTGHAIKTRFGWCCQFMFGKSGCIQPNPRLYST